MSIEPVVAKLREEIEANSRTKTKFFKWLERVHRDWHHCEFPFGIGPFGGMSIGFLSLHHELLQAYVARFDPKLKPGPMAKTDPAYPEKIDAYTDVVQFSRELEAWHNRVHRSMGGKFLDPRKNIYMRKFWQFQKFIDEKFLNWLEANKQNYEDLDHTRV